ncbi:VanW family protein [Corynebacterium sp. HMSC04H06]|uniref:VanW family protein n=1 Tax=Corynebacterium sp. HMSC04H06 TaxID=1581050 RepID=UPI001AEF881A|nr:VanW family protein [Corynebacterium sp. HMSC04H06]
MSKANGKRGVRGWAIALGILVGLFVIAGVAYAMDVVANQGKTPRAVSVGGVDISNMERRDAVAKLEDELGDVENQPVTVTAGEKTTEFIPHEAGLQMDFKRAVDGIEDASLNPFARVYSFFAPQREYDVDTEVDEAAFQPTVDRLTEDLTIQPKDGAINLAGGKVNVTDAVTGQSVDREELATEVSEGWVDPEGVEVDAEETEPAVTQDEVEKMAEGDAADAVAGDLVTRGRDDVESRITPAEVEQFVTVEPHDGKLELKINNERAQEMIGEALKPSVQVKQNASISFSGGSKQVTPHRDGVVIDWDKTMDGFDERVKDNKDREWDAEYRDEPATFTTEQAENASFDDVVGEFTTGGFSGASGQNIKRVADQVNGAFLAPGETFSLNGYTGPRGTAQGYVESGIIIDGRAGEAVGGGISQFATTLYNAAYFAGMEDTAHTPHSYYISRYPAGREATVYEGAIDLQFTNNSEHPVMISTSYSNSEITVQLKGTKTVEVESINNGRWAQTQPQPKQVDADDCSPSSGAPGFTTSDTRVIRNLSGQEISRETTTTVYDPQPIVTCS